MACRCKGRWWWCEICDDAICPNCNLVKCTTCFKTCCRWKCGISRVCTECIEYESKKEERKRDAKMNEELNKVSEYDPWQDQDFVDYVEGTGPYATVNTSSSEVQ